MQLGRGRPEEESDGEEDHENNGVSSGENPSNTAENTSVVTSRKRKGRVVEIGTDADGQPLTLEKRQRKKHSDAGVTQGPWKKNQKTAVSGRTAPEIVNEPSNLDARAATSSSASETAANAAAAAAAAENAALALAAGQAAMTTIFSLI